MNNLMRASLAAIAAFILAVVFAAAAHAASYYKSYTNWGNGWCTVYQHVDYDWWEEMQGKRDYRYAIDTYRCNPWSFSRIG